MARNPSGQPDSTVSDEIPPDPVASGAAGPDGAGPYAAAAAAAEFSPIILAARKGVAEIFASVASQMPDLIAAQAPPGSPIPAFTRAMIGELLARVERTLGPPAPLRDREP